MKKSKMKTCCESEEVITLSPDHAKEINRISRIAGQLDGIKRMISEREYCPKIITQIQAVRAALKSLESVVLEKHLAMCVKDTLNSRDHKEADKKMSELMELFRRN